MSDRSPVIKDPHDMPPHQRWITEINYAESELKKFHERARKVVRRFIDERDALDSHQKWFNLFYANTKILKAAMYAQMPKPDVGRKFVDYSDDIARVAAIILQRCITPDKDDPRDTFSSTMQYVVLDRLVPGLGQAWLRLETDIEDVEVIISGTRSIDTPLNSGFAKGVAPDEQKVQAEAIIQPPPPVVPPQGGGQPPQMPPQGPQMPPQAPPTMPSQGGGQPLPGPGGPSPAMGLQQQAVPPPPVMPPPPPQVMTFKKITDQRVCIDYVYWEDFIWSPCRIWEERRWAGRRVYMDHEALIKRFGEDLAEKIPLNYRPLTANMSIYPVASTPTHQAVQQACIYEIWDRLDRKIYWLCKDYEEILDEKDDFLNLVGFEPCPKPLFANITTSNTVPRPDYYFVQDQYVELDQLNNRISLLTKAVKAVGVYDSSASGIQRMLQEGVDNIMIPVSDWAMFAEKGGVQGAVDWLPLDKVVQALQRLYEARESTKAQIYELTGISDIVRGASKASETLGAQEIKAKFASVRIKDTQDEIAFFASELLRLKAEIMVKHYDPEILKRKSNILRTDDAQMADEALDMLQSEEGFEWRITVTSDQMAQADYAMEKQDRIELLSSVAGYLPQATAMIQQAPQMAPLLVNILKWVVSGFKGARDIEGMLDRELDNQLKAQQAAAGAPPEPTPEEKKTDAEIKRIEAKTQGDAKSAQIKQQSDVAAAKMKQMTNLQEMKFKAMKNQQDLQANSQQHRQKIEHSREESLFDMVDRMAKGSQDQQTHEQKLKQAKEVKRNA